jgi:hypothetical protein
MTQIHCIVCVFILVTPPAAAAAAAAAPRLMMVVEQSAYCVSVLNYRTVLEFQYLALKLLCYCNVRSTMSLARDLQAGTVDGWVGGR